MGVGWTCRGHRAIVLAPSHLAEAAAGHGVTEINADDEPSGGRSYGVIGLELGARGEKLVLATGSWRRVERDGVLGFELQRLQPRRR